MLIYFPINLVKVRKFWLWMMVKQSIISIKMVNSILWFLCAFNFVLLLRSFSKIIIFCKIQTLMFMYTHIHLPMCIHAGNHTLMNIHVGTLTTIIQAHNIYPYEPADLDIVSLLPWTLPTIERIGSVNF